MGIIPVIVKHGNPVGAPAKTHAIGEHPFESVSNHRVAPVAFQIIKDRKFHALACLSRQESHGIGEVADSNRAASRFGHGHRHRLRERFAKSYAQGQNVTLLHLRSRCRESDPRLDNVAAKLGDLTVFGIVIVSDGDGVDTCAKRHAVRKTAFEGVGKRLRALGLLVVNDCNLQGLACLSRREGDQGSGRIGKLDDIAVRAGAGPLPLAFARDGVPAGVGPDQPQRQRPRERFAKSYVQGETTVSFLHLRS